MVENGWRIDHIRQLPISIISRGLKLAGLARTHENVFFASAGKACMGSMLV